MRRASFVVGVTTLLVAGIALPAHAGGKRLPKAKSLVESIGEAKDQSPYVRGASTKPVPAQSGVLNVERPYNPTHSIREGAPAR